jgi:hypothetical protein
VVVVVLLLLLRMRIRSSRLMMMMMTIDWWRRFASQRLTQKRATQGFLLCFLFFAWEASFRRGGVACGLLSLPTCLWLVLLHLLCAHDTLLGFCMSF